jgi:hypothetical protein
MMMSIAAVFPFCFSLLPFASQRRSDKACGARWPCFAKEEERMMRRKGDDEKELDCFLCFLSVYVFVLFCVVFTSHIHVH